MTKLSNPALLTTTQPVLALFVAVFGISVGLVCALLRVRSGLYDPTDLPIFFRLFVFEDYWPAVVALFVAPAALLRPVQAAATRLAAFVGTHSGAFVLLALLLMCIGCVGVYRSHPLSMDEYAPYFQSQVFAAGRLAGQFPPQLLDWLVPAGFQNTFLFVSHDTGKIVSSYWPGFALLLTPFTWLGAPWLLNPLLGAASIWLVVRFVAEFSSDEHVLGLAALLTFGSAAFLVNSISFYSMSAHALLNGVFAYLLLRPTASRCAWAGAAGSVALVLHNPLPHVLFAVPWIVWLALRNDRVRNVAALVAGYLPVAVILGLGRTLSSTSPPLAVGKTCAPVCWRSVA